MQIMIPPPNQYYFGATLYTWAIATCLKVAVSGEALSLDKDRLDEIYTNNETDEACLEEMLELYNYYGKI